MDSEIPLDNALELSVMAAMSTQNQADARSFLRSLATLLQSILPDEATVQRSGLFGGDKRPVHRIELTLPHGEGVNSAARFTIEDSGHGPLVATRTNVVRGIALKTEQLPVADWNAAVAAGIARRAKDSLATRNALAGLM